MKVDFEFRLKRFISDFKFEYFQLRNMQIIRS